MVVTKKTKIVATIGPASDSPKIIAELIIAGVNVFRFNMKHADIKWHLERIELVKQISLKLDVSVGILIDLQGPEIRIKTQDGLKIKVSKGEIVHFVGKFFENEERQIGIFRKSVIENLNPGDYFSIDDGFCRFKVIEKQSKESLYAESIDDYEIGNNKGLNIPGVDIPLKSLTLEDMEKLDALTKVKIDFVALSFCRSKKDIDYLRKELLKRKMNVELVAKIESKQALDNIDEIIKAADVIMVARGDLGVETPIEQLAYWQKKLILKCREARKPVITATQMLQSMVENPMPTRAEATDVANAIFDGTDAVMLSGETASGRYPIKAVENMAAIARFNEPFANVNSVSPKSLGITELTVNGALEIVENSQETKVDGVIIFTQTGNTARIFSSHRSKVPVLAVTDSILTLKSLSLSFGILPVIQKFPDGIFSSADSVLQELLKKKFVFKGKTYLVIHGSHWKKPGLTNALFIITL